MDKEVLRALGKWFAACEPYPLDVNNKSDAALYVPFDDASWTEGDGDDSPFSVRGHHVVEDLVNEIALHQNRPSPGSAQLFAGFRGTGKSTELSRVAKALGDDYAVLRFKADSYHHMSDALSVEELALVLAAGIGEQAGENLGIELLDKKNVWERMSDFLKQEVEFKKAKLSFVEVELKGRLKQGGKFKDDLQSLLTDRPDTLKRFLHSFVEKISSNISPRQLVVLVDGLDKFTAPVERAGDVYRAMSDVFFHHAEMLALPSCHTIYTIPPYLAFINPGIAQKFGGRLHVLPSVRVHDRPPESVSLHLPGARAMEAVIDRRVALDRLFGEERDACVSILVSASGGQTRDLCFLVQEVIRIAYKKGLPVCEADVRRAVSIQEQSRGTLFREDLEILSTVHETGRLESLSKTQLGSLAGAMDQQLVLCYCNGEPWYDVHPLIWNRLPQSQQPKGA